MDYTVGSIADLISGKNTPNKPKVVQQEFKMVVKVTDTHTSSKTTNTLKSKNITSKFSNVSAPARKKLKEKIIRAVTTATPNTTKRNNFTNENKTGDNNKAKADKDPKNNKVPTNEFNAEKRVKKKLREESEKLVEDRTIFVGNVPLNANKTTLKRFFSKYGDVDTVRIRGVPVANLKVPKKVALIKKEFHPKRNSLHCFVRFQSSESAQKALQLNGQVYKDHHLRVCFANAKQESENNAIFIGNLSFNAEEEELWKLFEPCGNITSVRIVRDSRTGMGKGFGYVNFESMDSVELALQMDSCTLDGRQLRVSLCKANKQKKQRKVTVRPARKEKLKKMNEKQETNEKEDNEGNDLGSKPKKLKKKKDASKTEEITSGNYVGIKFTDKKKKKKVNKGLLQKKKLSKILSSK